MGKTLGGIDFRFFGEGKDPFAECPTYQCSSVSISGWLHYDNRIRLSVSIPDLLAE